MPRRKPVSMFGRNLLEGKHIPRFTAGVMRNFIGRSVRYLRKQDIDQRGRDSIVPRQGVIAAVYGRNIAIDTPDNFCLYMGDLVEMVLCT